MKKQLNETHISNELRGQSAFFPRQDAPQSPEQDTTAPTPLPPTEPDGPTHADASKEIIKQESNHASTLASTLEDIEHIRKAVKEVGREVTFVRLTREEKQQLADIVYTYKRQGVKTSENEVGRIAINALLIDYQTHGEESILAKVLAALLA